MVALPQVWLGQAVRSLRPWLQGHPSFPSLRISAMGMTALCHLHLVALLLCTPQARQKCVRSSNMAHVPSSALPVWLQLEECHGVQKAACWDGVRGMGGYSGPSNHGPGLGRGSWRGTRVCKRGAWGREEVGRWTRREGSTHKAVGERKGAKIPSGISRRAREVYDNPGRHRVAGLNTRRKERHFGTCSEMLYF